MKFRSFAERRSLKANRHRCFQGKFNFMERWYWIELIGFDNEQPDFGVAAFLSRNVSTVGVSLLFSNIDFIFEQQNEFLSPAACSYCGHEYNRERRRQNWTQTQLKGLIDTLHAHGVKVFFSSFDMTKCITDPDMLCYGTDGRPHGNIYVIKRFGKGLVGDLVADRIREVLDTYGFDGLHLADGLSSNRRSIENGDFSISLCADSKIDIPDALMTEDSYKARREWILENRRYEWISFICDRWAEFYRCIFDKIDKPIIFNNAWTRDSFEAIYRYGLDYRRCCPDRAYAVMIEENSATRSITAASDEGGVSFSLDHRSSFTYEYALMQQNIKLSANGLKQISLTPISDTMEQWDAIRHCPTELMRSILRRYNNFVFLDGEYRPCSDAPLYCLSDGIPASDWQWLAELEDHRVPRPDFACGFVAVSNPDVLDREIQDFCKHRSYFGSALLLDTMLGGLNLCAQIPLCEVENFTQARALIVTDLKSYSDKDRKILQKAKLPILVIGEDASLPLPCAASYKGRYISAALYNAEGIRVSFNSLADLENIIEAKPSCHGEIWTEPLSFPRIDGRFFSELCRTLNEGFELDRSLSDEVKVYSLSKDGEKYIFLSNDAYIYSIPTVKTDREIGKTEALTKYRGYPIRVKGNEFSVRIPPKCFEIVKIE